MKQVIRLYKQAYGGLSDAAWALALVMLINRAGSMVLPFLSIYLTQSLKFGIKEVGVVLAAYGLGAMAGSLLGGWLSDKIGNYYVQFLSLVVGGVFFLFLPQITEFEWLIPAVFIVSLTVECLRPANMASVASYSKPENLTRSYSLNRMAINLGFSVGPAVGGMLATYSYELLFYADGLTCISAGIFFFFYFRNKTPRKVKQVAGAGEALKHSSPYRDLSFLLFVFLVAGYAIVFFQLFNTLPLFYREAHQLSEGTIGLLLGLNGLIVFLFEMILVHYFEKRVSILKMIVAGTMLCGVSYAMLNLAGGVLLLVVAMFVLSFAEIMAMPFMVTHVINTAGKGKQGSYLGLYSLSWATAFMLAPYLGTRVVANSGFEILWWGSAGVAALVGLLFYINLLKRS
ncbi:Putative multidrug resistance protein [Fulvivirga imtechensis AK7]|uniref:Putative multidrug resistance protein n=1 Tax=Fulvivirga imtechensis AK7 TaxID=1237149 RepID=L8JTN3_9BACT|nr:MFS transporter [Fulvivirga imtechensis]ELR71603.1 Putative multidrug resistance protein [Fulvivirga imtechensis AK7]